MVSHTHHSPVAVCGLQCMRSVENGRGQVAVVRSSHPLVSGRLRLVVTPWEIIHGKTDKEAENLSGALRHGRCKK